MGYTGTTANKSTTGRRRKAKGADRHNSAQYAGGLDPHCFSSGSSSAASGMGLRVGKIHPNKKVQHYNKVINRQLTRTADLGDLSRLLDVIYMYLMDMNGINLATAFHRVAKLNSIESNELKLIRLKRHPIFERLFQKVVQHVTNHSLLIPGVDKKTATASPASTDGWEMPVQCMSIVTWACATLRLRHETLFAKIAWIVGPRIDQLKSFELSNLLWAYAKLTLASPELFHVTAERLFSRQPGEFKAQCLSTIAWSFATAEQRNAALFGSIADELASNATEMKTQEIANTLWAFARNRYAHVELFNALGDSAVNDSKIPTFKYQELSNTVWAFATIGLPHPELFDKVEIAAARKRDEMAPQNIANILWSYAKLRVPSRSNMFPALLDTAMGKLAQHKRQELSTVIWAAAQACPSRKDFFGAAAKLCLSRLREFSPNAIANLTKDLGMVQTSAPECFMMILRESLRRLVHFEPAALCILIRGIIAAYSNPCFAPDQADICAAAVTVSVQLARLSHRLRPAELTDISDTLRSRPAALAKVAALETLERASSAAKERCQHGNRHHGPAEIAGVDAGMEAPDSPRSETPSAGAYLPEVRCTPDDMQQLLAGHDQDVSATAVVSGECAAASFGHRSVRWCQTDSTASPASAVPPYSECGPITVSSSGTHYSQERSPALPQPGEPWTVPLASSSCVPTMMPPLLSSFGPPQATAYPPPTIPGSAAWSGSSHFAPLFPPPVFPTWTASAGDQPGHAPALCEPYMEEVASRPDFFTRSKSSERVPSVPFLGSSCLLQEGPDGEAQTLDLLAFPLVNILGLGDHVVTLRHGLIDLRVVLKRTVGLPKLSTDCEQSQRVLQPVAVIVPDADLPNVAWGGRSSTAATPAAIFVAYKHCKYGNLSEWVSKRRGKGHPLSREEVARVARTLLSAVDDVSSMDPEIVSSVQPDEIFVDATEQVYLRRCLPGSRASWGDALKWFSPEEATGSLQCGPNTCWAALSFRLGMVLYCLGLKGTLDPYPEHTGEIILMDLIDEVDGNRPPRRPALDYYEGPEVLRRLVGFCLRLSGPKPPSRLAVDAVLTTMLAPPGEPAVDEPADVSRLHDCPPVIPEGEL